MIKNHNVQIIIPARFASTRLPGKVLEKIDGKSLIQHVVIRAKEVCDNVVVACDDQRIASHCSDHRMKCIMTDSSHQSGTDRIAEAARSSNTDIIINLQADEPFIEPEVIQVLIDLMHDDEVHIGTLIERIEDKDLLFDYNIVKVVTSLNNNVLYFSRQAIPAQRDVPYRQWMQNSNYFRHIGIYGFKNQVLQKVTKLEQTNLEKLEKLEQLRWLENGYHIKCAVVHSKSFGIDTAEDLERARNIALH